VLCVVHVADARPNELDRVLEAGRVTAEASSYEALRSSWRALMRGFVALPDDSPQG
jgi:hypothetical protein